MPSCEFADSVTSGTADGMSLVYLDACTIIEAIEKPTQAGQAVINLIADLAGDETPFITSELALLEVLVKPIQALVDRVPAHEDQAKRSEHDWYQGNLTADGLLIQTRPISREILTQAAIIRARIRSIKTPDAIHIATAYRHKCTHFITGDAELAKKLEADSAWRASEGRVRFVNLDAAALDALRAELLS
jgi:predicted nucleic acid-binding protein